MSNATRLAIGNIYGEFRLQITRVQFISDKTLQTSNNTRTHMRLFDTLSTRHFIDGRLNKCHWDFIQSSQSDGKEPHSTHHGSCPPTTTATAPPRHHAHFSLGRLGIPPLQIKVLRGGALQSTLGPGLVVGEIPIGHAGTDDAKGRDGDAEQNGSHVVAGDGPVPTRRGGGAGIGRLGRLGGVGEGPCASSRRTGSD